MFGLEPIALKKGNIFLCPHINKPFFGCRKIIVLPS